MRGIDAMGGDTIGGFLGAVLFCLGLVVNVIIVTALVKDSGGFDNLGPVLGMLLMAFSGLPSMALGTVLMIRSGRPGAGKSSTNPGGMHGK